MPARLQFASRLANVYANNPGWTIPASSPEAHHIQPLRWAGSNNSGDPVMPNGVFLASTDHAQFTHWWRYFTTSSGEPPDEDIE